MITSASNSKLKLMSNLISKSKARKEEGMFVSEGLRIVLETPVDRLVCCFISDKLEEESVEKVRKTFPEDKIEVVKDELLSKVADTKSPQGIMAIVKIEEADLSEFLDLDNGLLILLDDLQDPGNLGSIIRTAEGAGVNAIICTKNSVDIYNPKAVRSTMGAMYRVPVCYTDDMVGYIGKLIDNGYNVYASDMDGGEEHFNVRMKGKCALVVGNEANGISDAVIEASSSKVKIPMLGKLESLNASVAAALLMYEARRQRLMPDPEFDFRTLFSDRDRATSAINKLLDK